MATDPWRQWQAFAALCNRRADRSPAPRASPADFAPFIDAERFAAAARAFTRTASGVAGAAAAQAFGDFLRDQFASFSGCPERGSGRGSGSAAKKAPALGPTREHQERWQRAAEAWRRLDEAQRRLQRLWSDTLREAARAFIARLRRAEPRALTPEALHRAIRHVDRCAEEAYARTAHSEAFAARSRTA